MKRLIYLLPLLFVLSLPACAGNPKPDTSQLTAAGLRDYKDGEAVDIVNDVTTGVRAAVKTHVLPVAIGAQLLTVNKQVLDVISAHPGEWKSAIPVIVKNARDALPAEWKARADLYLQQLLVIIQGASA